MKTIGVDIGATTTRCILQNDGKLLKNASSPTPKKKKKLKETLFKLIQECWSEDIEAIGIGAPGQISEDRRLLLFAPNIGIRNVSLVEWVQDRYKREVILENDVRCAALAEKEFGAAKGERNFLCVFIGTGIGGAAYINGELLRGSKNVAGEFGHIKIGEKEVCGCGAKGCFEAIVSGPRIIEYARQFTKNCIDISFIESAYKKGEGFAKEVFEWAAEKLCLGLSSLVNIFNPSLLIIGGGVIEAGPSLFTLIKERIEAHCLRISYRSLKIKRAALGEFAPAFGAALLPWKQRFIQ